MVTKIVKKKINNWITFEALEFVDAPMALYLHNLDVRTGHDLVTLITEQDAKSIVDFLIDHFQLGG